MKLISIVMPSAIIIFILAMLWEYFYTKLRSKKKIYDLGDTFTNLGTGIIQQTFSFFTKGAHLMVFMFIHDKYKVVEVQLPTIFKFVLATILMDFAYYWWHRASHRIGLLWAAHIVHHQSEYYNLSVALRQSAITALTSIPFFVPIAFLGIGPMEYGFATLFTSLYQFWIHTQTIGKLGWFEKIFNTPSHHRVHHGINPQYLDKNHGATLIIWDRLFSTFAEEKEEVVYGVTTPFLSFDPVKANVIHYRDLYLVAQQDYHLRYDPLKLGFTSKLFYKTICFIRALLAPPDWAPGEKLSWSKRPPLPKNQLNKIEDKGHLPTSPTPRLHLGKNSSPWVLWVTLTIGITFTALLLLKSSSLGTWGALGISLFLTYLLHFTAVRSLSRDERGDDEQIPHGVKNLSPIQS